MEILEFKYNMPKLCNQRKAKLVYHNVITMIGLEKYKDLLKYDLDKGDGKDFQLDNSQYYLILLFVGDKGIMFTSLRKYNSENIAKYADIGKEFVIEIENDNT